MLAAFQFVFKTRRLHPESERRRTVGWEEDGNALVIAGEWQRLLPVWGDEHASGVDPVVYHRKTIMERLTGLGWLSIERQGRQIAVRPGPRLTGEATG